MTIFGIVVLPMDADLAKQSAENWLEDQEMAKVLVAAKAKTPRTFLSVWYTDILSRHPREVTLSCLSARNHLQMA